jgi:uncharacterized membrane protein
MATFSKTEAVKTGWEKFKKYPWVLIGITLVVMILPSLVQYILQMPFKSPDPNEMTPMMWIGTLASVLISIFLTIGLIRVYLQLTDGKPIQFSDLFNVKADEYVRYIIGSILYGLIVLGGLILLVIPGIYFGIKYQYYSYQIIDKQNDPLEAIKQSGHITKGNILNLFLFSLLLMLISILGVIALLVGILVAAPVVGIAQAYVYRKLTSGVKK